MNLLCIYLLYLLMKPIMIIQVLVEIYEIAGRLAQVVRSLMCQTVADALNPPALNQTVAKETGQGHRLQTEVKGQGHQVLIQKEVIQDQGHHVWKGVRGHCHQLVIEVIPGQGHPHHAITCLTRFLGLCHLISG